MNKPIIVVTSNKLSKVDDYCNAITSRGGEIRLALSQEQHSPENLLDGSNGLLLTGGPDISPTIYKQPSPLESESEPDHVRDEMELKLLNLALDRDLPILGICRGMQLINVALGGSLIPDIPNHKGDKIDNDWASIYHQIFLSPGTKLAAILGSGGFLKVNSRHHQGLKNPQKSPNLLASAYSLGDGIIEALESPKHDWVIGIQFHIESEMEVPKSFGSVFQGFLERER